MIPWNDQASDSKLPRTMDGQLLRHRNTTQTIIPVMAFLSVILHWQYTYAEETKRPNIVIILADDKD